MNPSSHNDFPQFARFLAEYQLASLMRPYPHTFDKVTIDGRQELYRRLCEIIWDMKRLGLTVPSPVATVRKPARRAPKPLPMAPLLDAGAVAAGETLFGVRRTEEFTATVLPDGRIEVPTGEVFAEPATAGAWVLSLSRPRFRW